MKLAFLQKYTGFWAWEHLQRVRSESKEKKISNFKIQAELKAKGGCRGGSRFLKESSNPCSNKVDLYFLEKTKRPVQVRGISTQ